MVISAWRELTRRRSSSFLSGFAAPGRGGSVARGDFRGGWPLFDKVKALGYRRTFEF